MNVRDAVMAGIAKQLGHPSGLRGRFVGVALNRGNRRFVNAAAQALEPRETDEVADVGFGGGVGLKFLLARAGRSGRVHGVEISDTMLAAAARRYRRDIADGRLTLHEGSLTQLPFADGQLSGVITVNTIYFVPELDRACAELVRVVNTSGRIVIGLVDPDAMAEQAKFSSLPWTYTISTTNPAVIANVVAQGNSDRIGCRITVNGEIRDEQSSSGHHAQTFCLVKAA